MSVLAKKWLAGVAGLLILGLLVASASLRRREAIAVTQSTAIPNGPPQPVELSTQQTNADGDPLSPTTMDELLRWPNDNKALAKFFSKAFTTVTPENQRVTMFFDGGEVGSPFIKTGANAGYCEFGSQCMVGVVKLSRFRWFAYRWNSRRDKVTLCLVSEGATTFDCFDARTGITRTAPEKYHVLEFNSQIFTSVLPVPPPS